MKFIFQLLLCVVLLGAGVAGFLVLKNGKLPSRSDVIESPADDASGAQVANDESASAGAPAAQSESKPVKPWPVAVENVVIAATSPTVGMFGTVETPRETNLTAAVNADVVDVNALEGQRVGKGEALVELDATDIRLNIAQRKAELAEIDANVAAQQRRYQANLESLEAERELLRLSQNQLERYSKLAKRQIGTRAAADDAARVVKQQELAITTRQNAIDDHATTMATFDARRARSQAQLAQSERDLDRTLITAPFAGVLTAVTVSPGDRVRSGEPLITLYDTDFVEVRAQIPNRHVATVQEALANGVTINATGTIQDTTTDLRLDRLAAVAKAGSGGVDALLRVTGGTAPGLGRTINVVLNLPPVANAFSTPGAAVVDGCCVFVVRDNKLVRISTTRVGEIKQVTGGSRVLMISDDIKDGDQIVVSQVPSARDGLVVQVTTSTE